MRVLPCFILWILLLGISILPSSQSATPTPTPGNETDRLALLAFRDRITQFRTGTFTSWNKTVGFCEWEGVTCSNRSQRVVALDLNARGLVGSLSPFLGNLTLLEELGLGDNSLHGNIPPELGNLINLRILNLTTNSLGGEIPADVSRCMELEILELSTNRFVGEIPTELTTLSKLEELYLLVNNITGEIPKSIGNLTSLTKLAIGRNALRGSIPDSVGLLTRLKFLQTAENQLSGMIPQSLYNLSSLEFIAIAANRLRGSLPPSLGLAFPRLQTLYVGGNMLSGPIPASLLNASGLVNLDFGDNNFTGPVPTELGILGGLEWLNFEGNQVGTGDTNDLNLLITSLGNCTKLQVFDIDGNRFGGLLPTSLANLSSELSMLIMSGNRIYGSVPHNIDMLAGLTVLRLEKNLLTGDIPDRIGKLPNLQILSLFGNKFSGHIPSSLGNLTQLNELRLANNTIRGSIPSSLADCTNLQYLDLSRNRLDGTIPAQVISISSLSVFLSLAHNSLFGSLPVEVGNLKNLGELDISENRLSGEIPRSIGDCESLEYLHMQANKFQGSIPPSFSKLKGLRYLDLSRNQLSGQIPEYLASLNVIRYLNLSFNDVEGPVPQEGVFKNHSSILILGNTKLCGGIPALELPSCTIQSSKKNIHKNIVIAIVCSISGLVFVMCLYIALYYRKRSSRIRQPMTSSLRIPYAMVSHKELFEATNGFSPANMIGEGSFGTVYKGTLNSNGKDIAVKVFNLEVRGASKSFMAECEALRNIRHRNLVKILTLCSSVDANGNHFKALVYEFMPNGSLDDWLHPDLVKQHDQKVLNYLQRLEISTDVAFALDYLHHQCRPLVVHCDLKPSNVLLDEDMTAHVGDFGLATILLNDTNAQFKTSSLAIKGSIGYIPPEYGAGAEASTQGDVYSYGILVLEMFTGKRPTDDSFKDGTCLHDFVRTAYPDRVMEIIDPQMPLQARGIRSVADNYNNQISSEIKESLVSVFRIGLSCSSAMTSRRMEMREVASRMQSIKSSLFGEGYKSGQFKDQCLQYDSVSEIEC